MGAQDNTASADTTVDEDQAKESDSRLGKGPTIRRK
jgi:hypothetical protein